MNILLIRLSSFGDIVLTTPAIRALRSRYPDARIDFAVYDRFAATLAHHPGIDNLYLVPKKQLKQQLAEGNYRGFWLIMRKFIQEIREVPYDYIVDLHNVTESALVAIAAKGRVKVGHRKQLLSLLFTVRSRFDIGFASATMHAAESALSFLVDAGCLAKADLPEKPRLEFIVPSGTAAGVDEYLRQQELTGKRLIGINPCASYDFKRWSPERFAAVADYLATEFGYTVLLFGSPAEQAVVQQVMNAMRRPAVDTSSLPIFQAFELIRRLELFVTNDSAPMHIAAAFGTPLVALHGPINVKKFSPLTDRARSMSKQLPCLPCKDIKKCPSRDCFGLVTVEEVCAACRDLLASLSKAEGGVSLVNMENGG